MDPNQTPQTQPLATPSFSQPPTQPDQTWNTVHLINRSFSRVFSRLIPLILLNIIGLILGVILFIANVFIGQSLTPNNVATMEPTAVILFILLGLVSLASFIALATWLGLAYVRILTSQVKMGPIHALKSTLPLIASYFLTTVQVSLFTIGLAPAFGINFVWGVWNSFTLFAFLEQGAKGLNALWISKEMVSQKFWGILWRTSVVCVAPIFILIFLDSILSDNFLKILMRVGILFVFMIVIPFTISFNYEMYRLIGVPQQIVKPKDWILASKIGWIIGGILIVVILTLIVSGIFLGLGLYNRMDTYRPY
ncbi:hypothetical protein HGA88_05115 [Candidatus Roizmanbacteria bacterium]|nr:hypothetical protein [Candidatus Roizmanbacteria bacterium]